MNPASLIAVTGFGMSLGTLLRFNLRYYRRHILLSLLCLLGISLGVGIVVAVELINKCALESFSASVDLLSGKATHSVVSDYGMIPEGHFAGIWRNSGVKAATPVVEAMATAVETGKEPIRFIGLDPFLDAEFRTFTPEEGDGAHFMAFLTREPVSLYLSRDLMGRYGLKAGDTLTVLTAGVEKKARIIDALPGSEEISLGDNLAVVDIAGAQELFGKVGYLDRIDIVVDGDAEAVRKELPQGLSLEDRGERKTTLKSMLYSFQLNLAAMSLLALFVGIFLIYNFSMFSVLSRREDMSLLLTLGADRKGLVAAFLMESLILGAAGSLVGLGFGYVVAWFSMEKVTTTISNLYFHVTMNGVQLTPGIALIGIGVGFCATLAGTALPALEVAGTPPILGMKRRTIEDRAHGLKGLLSTSGIVCMILAAIAAWASRFSVFWGFASAFAATLALALFTPSILSPLTHYVGRFLIRVLGSLEGFLAARTIRASLSRTSVAVAALAVALSMTTGVDNMIHSFRESVRIWLQGSLQGDLYISPGTTRWAHPLPEELIEKVTRDPRVEAVERYSSYPINLKGKPIRLAVLDGDVLMGRSRFHFLKGGDRAWERLIRGGLFVSESLAYRFRVGLGDDLELETPLGKRSFKIVAVTRDYSSDRGSIQMHRPVYEAIWKDRRIQSVALFLKPESAPDAVRRSIASQFPGLNRTIVSNAKMKTNILAVFDKTFAPTATLKGASLLVALLGVATALTAILMERSREMTVLGYLGLTSKELGRVNVYQAVIMGIISFVIAAVGGVLLAHILIYAVNYRSFGWTVDVYISPVVFAKTFALTLAACLVSSIYPTLLMQRAERRGHLQEE